LTKKDRFMTTIDLISTMNTEVKTETTARCSIILPAGNNFSRLKVYLLCLSEMKLSDEYEIIVINDHDTKINEGQLRTFLPSLKILSPGGLSSQERLFDKAAMVARGKFLLYVKSLIIFDKLVLEESINELETSGEKLSVSANNNFVFRPITILCWSKDSITPAWVGTEDCLALEIRSQKVLSILLTVIWLHMWKWK